MNAMEYNFKDFSGKVWLDSDVDYYNRKVETYNYALKNQPTYISKAREAVSDAFHHFCGGSIMVSG